MQKNSFLSWTNLIKFVPLIFILLLLSFNIFAESSISMYYMGIVPGGAVEFESSFSKKLRDRLSTSVSINLVDQEEVDRLKKKVDFTSSSNVNREMVEYLRENADEKSLVVFAKIDNYSIHTKRDKGVFAKVAGAINFKLYVYSLYFGTYEYIGTLSAESEIFKGLIFFSDAREINISAMDREKIKEDMIMELLNKSEDMIVGIVGGELLKSGLAVPKDVKAEKVPSVSDMFNIPSVSVPEAKDAKK